MRAYHDQALLDESQRRGGEPRRKASPDINTEDFLAAVDFLSVQDNVDPERIGIIGICGFGGMAVNGGVIDPLLDDAPWFVKDYHNYYKTKRGYHERSGNSNDGWNATGCQSFLNQPILAFANEIDNPVLLIPGASHVDLYDDVAGVIPYDKMEAFFKENLK